MHLIIKKINKTVNLSANRFLCTGKIRSFFVFKFFLFGSEKNKLCASVYLTLASFISF